MSSINIKKFDLNLASSSASIIDCAGLEVLILLILRRTFMLSGIFVQYFLGTDKLTRGHGLSRHNSALGAGNRVASSHFRLVYWV